MAKPFIKWVGGKRQLLPELQKRLPKTFNNYFEPFIGGGALLFHLKPQNAFINDYNHELTNLYEVVRDSVEDLIKDLKKHKNDSEYYYDVRAWDRNKRSYSKRSHIKKASRFIFLNRTGFNGLYRVNKNGEHNVPFGKYKNPNYCDAENLIACSEYLQSVKIFNEDFEKVIKENIQKGDFVYFDPPYVPVNKTSSFTSYTDQGFDRDMQIRLRDLCLYIDSIGGKFMLSNSYTSFVKDLYKDFKIEKIKAKRVVNSKGSGRGDVFEVVVRNYDV